MATDRAGDHYQRNQTPGIVRSVHKRVRVAVVLITCLLVLAACGFGPGSRGLPDRPGETGGEIPRGILGFQPPFLPVTFSIDTSGNIAVIVNPVKLVTLVGTVTFGAGIFNDLTGKPLPAPELADVTELVICQKDNASKPCQIYQIGSGRKMHIEMNGNFIGDVERKRTTIYVSPGSIINVTDGGPPTKPPAYQSTGPPREDVEEFHFSATGAETDVDLERSRSGTTTDLSYDHITAALKTINGAEVALYSTHGWWTKPSSRNNYPSENECKESRKEHPEVWKNLFSKDDLNARYSIYCIKTAEGDFGFLFIEPDFDQKPIAYYVYSDTWVR